ncbi:extracellular calcium-sensing receptor-like [Sphaeramia orbicularis]|uniref:extracellular calcium-sensing receptor-like n=1 Tax=Sphaeramia orbicularis TaxID=375764 RepID=UPI0011816E3B|nr:extracellular calcium-sensing receptor-like [Sphaeramia orbicularis]
MGVSPSCNLQGQFHLNGMHKTGDVVLGGLFEVHFFSVFPDLSFTSQPQQLTCHGFDVLGFRQAQTMAFAIDEINRNYDLLPNVTLGYSLYDNCVELGVAFRAALSLVSGQEKQFVLDDTCVGIPPVLGIVGDSSSTNSIAISNVLGLYRVPMVSYFATCSCLSDRQMFPSFFRTIPSDAFQVRAMLQILKHFSWTWAGLLVSDDDYGLHAARSFQVDLAETGAGCLAYLEVLPKSNNPAEFRRIVNVMRKSTARVVIVFAQESRVIHLMEEVIRQNVTGLQWMASEAWTAATVLQTPRLMPYLGGTLCISIRRGELPGLSDFLLQTSPAQDFNTSYGNNMVRQFWEHTFQCKFAPPPVGWVETGGTLCTGKEDLVKVETEFFDLSNLRAEYNVYKAVYALAYALNNMLRCEPGNGPFRGNSCASLQRLEPWQLVHYLQKVNFTTSFGDQVSFDKNGDALPIYDIMNWLWLPDGRTKVQTVGEVKKSAFKGEELRLDEDKIFWNFESKKPPRSVCSEKCPPGTRRARRKGEPECCFDCILCSEGQFSNETDSMECTSCPEDFWSSPQRDHCVPKKTEFLSYHEPLGICLTTASLLGKFICAAVLGIFIYHRKTPIVSYSASCPCLSDRHKFPIFFRTTPSDVYQVLEEEIQGKQFLASEAWSTSDELLENLALTNLANGVVGVAIRSSAMPGFGNYVRKLNPYDRPDDVLIREYWEEQFGCSPGTTQLHGSPLSSNSSTLPSGTESLEEVHNHFTDMSQLRWTYNVYLAVYAAAHALHSLLSCPNRDSPTNNSSTCSFAKHIKPREKTPEGSLKLVLVGHVDESKVQLSESAIQWNTGSNEVPVSVCSKSCPPGTRKANRKGEPVCCFDCIPCGEGEISNITGSLHCEHCPSEFWPNAARTVCIRRQIDFLSFNEKLGITLTTVAVSGVIVTTAVFVVFLYYRQTPMVRANNSELSFLLLLSLKLCFLCSLVFIGRPSVWSCRFQQAAFGISFVLSVSCLLVKTMVVLAAFRSARPGAAALMKWFGPGLQRGSVCLFTSVQIIICIIWLSLSPPVPHRDLGIQGSKVTLKCAMASVVGFSLVLGYIGLLACSCLLLAFLARKLPDNFNEAKLITFSMLIFCAVWVAFVPAYVSSPGKYVVAVEVFAILASSYGLLFCIFAPKCFIILFRPEKNTKKHLMAR